MAITAPPIAALRPPRTAATGRSRRRQAAALRELAQARPYGFLQAKLTVGPANDRFEQEADAVAERVMRMDDTHGAQGERAGLQPVDGAVQRLCRGCEEELHSRPAERIETEEGQEELVRPQAEGASRAQSLDLETAGSINAMRGRGRPLPPGERAFFEPRFGRDFSNVRIHADACAAQAARAIGARAFTIGSDVAFAAGQYGPGTPTGRHLLAHELAHVLQQGNESFDGAKVIQRVCNGPAMGGNSIASRDEDDYRAAVRQGKYCLDTGLTGIFHDGRCYREVPPRNRGFPHGDQVCFDPKTGACSEDSPDVVSAVEGRNANGSCNLSFTRSLGHFAEDILPSEPGMAGTGAGLLAGSALGLATTGNWKGAAVGAATGLVSGLTFGEWARPVGGWLGSRGYVPTVGASSGIANPIPNLVDDATWQARLYVGASRRQGPLLSVFYPEFKLGVTLIGESESPGGSKIGPSAVASLAPGIRLDPGEAGGTYVSFFGGPALAIGKGNIAMGQEAGVTFGTRWRWVGVTANVTYVGDPTRPEGSDKMLQFGIGVELGPNRP
jgi:hypothetical protein